MHMVYGFSDQAQISVTILSFKELHSIQEKKKSVHSGFQYILLKYFFIHPSEYKYRQEIQLQLLQQVERNSRWQT